MRTSQFLVTIPLPVGMTIEDARKFVECAVRSEGGHYPPDDPEGKISKHRDLIQVVHAREDTSSGTTNKFNTLVKRLAHGKAVIQEGRIIGLMEENDLTRLKFEAATRLLAQNFNPHNLPSEKDFLACAAMADHLVNHYYGDKKK